MSKLGIVIRHSSAKWKLNDIGGYHDNNHKALKRDKPEYETWENLLLRDELTATQGKKDGPNKKTCVSRKKKVFDGEETTKQLEKKLNLESILTETNSELRVVN